MEAVDQPVERYMGDGATVSWFIGARVFYSGFTKHRLERVRRPIVVVNAP